MHALRVLEWDKVQARLALQCETPGARAAALALMPQFEPEAVTRELSLTSEAVALGDSGRPTFAGMRDVLPGVKSAAKGQVLDASTLAQVGWTLTIMRIARAAMRAKREVAPRLFAHSERLPEIPRLEDKLEASVDMDGEVRDSASAALASARSKRSKLAQRIQSRMQEYVSGHTREYLSDTVVTQRAGRYVIPLKAEHKGKVRGIVHDSSGSGATVYLEPEDVVQMGNQLREAEAAERAEIERVLRELSRLVGDQAASIADGIEAAAEIDLACAKARMGDLDNGCLPTLTEPARLSINAGRHPLLDAATAIPLSIRLGGEHDAVLITGPNTGGKTVAIKTVGLHVAMAQAGLMPPAHEMKFGPFSQIWADIGDEQSLQQSLSTFSGHIRNISRALSDLKPGALVLFDEIGAGTDPAEGAALGRALLLEFQRRGARILASTHYGELKVFASNQPGFVNASMEFDLKSLRPTYRFQLGTPGSSHAFRIAERYGIPPSILEEAQAGFSEQEQDVGRMIERLEQAQKQAQRAQGEADRLAAKLRQVEQEAERKLAAAEEARQTVRRRVSDELTELLRQIRIEAAEVFSEVKKGGKGADLDQARRKLRDLQTVGESFIAEMRPDEKRRPSPLDQLVPGAKVRVAGLGMVGTLLGVPSGGKVELQAGAMKMKVEVAKLELLEAPRPPARNRSAGRVASAMKVAKAATISREIHLRQMRAEEAKEALEQFFDDAILAGADQVRIIHGKGEGVLRKITHDFLRRHPQVASFEEADADSGGQGATIARLQ